ncbi:MAG: hypothetical protein VYC00_03275 [Candidatus Neomarinimicrobiota bacterium]|jgi:hypothetical protein|uniref:Uncharacterized protein n=1 Tax=marine metagenome TaxID=408172 RepID=A0A381WXW3_9ZZZZ|nr:hypothetical protein [Candidatus Neomarinimicrobiota bacterium]
MIVRIIKLIAFLFVFMVVGLAQSDFNLEDLNPNSETYGDTIGPADYLGDICIVFFGHEY